MFFLAFNIFRGLIGVISFVLAITAAVWTFFDAKRRGYPEWFWSGISFSIFPLGLLGYLLYRAFEGVRSET